MKKIEEMKKLKNYIIIFAVIGFVSNIFAQEVTKSKSTFDIGADFASRYVWRGLEFSDSPAVQPYLEFKTGDLTLGAWASYETGGQVVGQEFDIYASYAIGPISLGFTDYSFPRDLASAGYFMIRRHTGEATISFDGVKKFPLSIMIGVNVYNDDSNSVYTELKYPFTVDSVKLEAFIAGGNGIYATNTNYKLTNFGLTASKDIKITDSYSLGVSASAIFNPDTDDSYLVFTISI